MELLTYLKERRIPAAVATSTARKEASRYWDMAGVTPYLTASVCGDEVTKGKPDPEIFLTAARKAGVAPETALCWKIPSSASCCEAGRYEKRLDL